MKRWPLFSTFIRFIDFSDCLQGWMVNAALQFADPKFVNPDLADYNIYHLTFTIPYLQLNFPSHPHTDEVAGKIF